MLNSWFVANVALCSNILSSWLLWHLYLVVLLLQGFEMQSLMGNLLINCNCCAIYANQINWECFKIAVQNIGCPIYFGQACMLLLLITANIFIFYMNVFHLCITIYILYFIMSIKLLLHAHSQEYWRIPGHTPVNSKMHSGRKIVCGKAHKHIKRKYTVVKLSFRYL